MNGHANYEYLVLYSARLKIMVMATILRRSFYYKGRRATKDTV